jgi:hypothetical protein
MTNMKKLAILKMSTDSVPNGGGLDSALKFLMNPKAISEGAKKASECYASSRLSVERSTSVDAWNRRVKPNGEKS